VARNEATGGNQEMFAGVVALAVVAGVVVDVVVVEEEEDA